MARQPAPRLPARRAAGGAGGPGHPGRDVQPDDLRQGHRRRQRLRRTVRRPPGHAHGRGRLLGARRHRHPCRLGGAAARARRLGWPRRLHLARGVPRAGPRHGRHHPRCPSLPRARGRAQPLRQDPRHGRGSGRRAGHDRRGSQHQHHPPVQPGALRRGDRGLHRGSRGPRRQRHRRPLRGAQRGVVLREPGRHRSRPPARGARRHGAPRPRRCHRGAARHRRRGPGAPGLRAVHGPVLRTALGGPGGPGRQRAAAPVGVHVDQEPGVPRPRLRRQPHRARHRQHHARRDRRRLRRPRHAGAHRRRRPRRRRRRPGLLDGGQGGVDMADVARTLEDEGVASFTKSFDELLQSLSDKANALSAGS